MKISKHARGGYYTTLTIKGKKNFIYGATPDEVDTKYTEMKYRHRQGYNVNDNPTFEEYASLWYTTYKKDKGALKTQEMYRNCINNHLNPVLGPKKIKEITATQVQALLNSITSSKSLAHKVRITLNQIYKRAIADRLTVFNPVTDSDVIAPDDPKRVFLTPKQRSLLLQILVDGHRSYPIILTILHTGMRMGEALALLWKDVDFEKEIIRVTKAVEFEHSKPKQKDPKSERGFREIPMSDALIDYLKRYQKAAKKRLYVFPGHTGGPMGLTEMQRIWRSAGKKIRKWFKDNPDMKECEFNLTFRLLRHTYCTGLYDAEVDEVSAAEIMGHDIVIMRKIYTHLQNARRQKTAVKIKNIYQEPSPEANSEPGQASEK
jgi:integrase